MCKEKYDKAIKHFTNMRNENQVKLDKFKKEIEQNKGNETTYSTLVYDNRAVYLDLAIEALVDKRNRIVKEGES